MPPIESTSRRRLVAAMPIGMSCRTGCASTVMALILLGQGQQNNALAEAKMHEGSKGCTTEVPRNLWCGSLDCCGPVAVVVPVAPGCGCRRPRCTHYPGFNLNLIRQRLLV